MTKSASCVAAALMLVLEESSDMFYDSVACEAEQARSS